jgi:ribosomal protein S18 acetylase RimI-like enzyme
VDRVRISRLGPGDEAVVIALAEREPPPTRERAGELLADERTVFLVAFDGDIPAGHVLAYELVRRHGPARMLFLYDVWVDERYRRRGIASALLAEVSRIARERGIEEGFVLTNASNEAAMRLYEAAGGVRPSDDDVMWDFDFTAG